MSAFTWALPSFPAALFQGEVSFSDQQVFTERLLRARQSLGAGDAVRTRGPKSLLL